MVANVIASVATSGAAEGMTRDSQPEEGECGRDRRNWAAAVRVGGKKLD